MIIVDARNFQSSSGALLALMQHVRLMRLARQEVRILMDESTYNCLVDLRLDPEGSLVISNAFKFYLNIFKFRFSNSEIKVFCPHAVSFFKIFLLSPFFQTYYWVQGLVSDEMRIRGEPKSKIFAMRVFEYLGYKLCTKLIVVSDAMRNELASRFSNRRNVYTVPCLPRTSRTSDKKIKNSFVYVGGMSAWQRVDRALEFYDRYKDVHPSATLTLATGQRDEAWRFIKAFIKPENLGSVSVVTIRSAEEMNQFLTKAEFGFLLRDPLPLNKVASPIKFGEYVSCGVSVIISPCVGDFSEMVEKYNAGLVWSGSENEALLTSVEQNVIKLYRDQFNEQFFSKIYES